MGGGEQGLKFYEADEFVEWAEREFRAGRRLSDGATAGDHSESAARQWAKLGKKAKEEPDRPACPWQFHHIWTWFCQLSARRQPGLSGAAPLSHMEIAAWRDLYSERIEPWEIALITRLDDKWLEVQFEEAKKKAAQKPKR